MNEVFKNLMILYCLDAPEWARYAAVDSNGDIFVYRTKPLVDSTLGYHRFKQWTYNSNDSDVDKNTHEFHHQIGTIALPNNLDWKETLLEL